jgi:c-di-GMP-binding flagellar brake protein YcgR
MQQASDGRSLGALSIGQRLEFGYDPSSPAGRAASATEWLASRLEDQAEDGTWLTVAWPTDSQRRLIMVEPGDAVAVAASTPSDALYAADAMIEAIIRVPVPLLTVRICGAWRRTQRRNAVRTSVAIRPRVADKRMGQAHKSLRLGLTNISASGVQVRSQDELHSGDLLDLAFELSGIDQEVQVKARVRRVYRQERERPGHAVWDAGCEFEGLPDRLGQRIVQYIFAQQRAVARMRRGQEST